MTDEAARKKPPEATDPAVSAKDTGTGESRGVSSEAAADNAPKPPAKAMPAKLPAKTAKKPAPAAYVPPPASEARPKVRHHLVLLSFILLVVAPIAITSWYLWTRAADQYVSTMGFTVRREETTSAGDLLGGLSNLSSSGSSDADVLYEYIQSQELVRRIDAELDLRQLYSIHQKTDPVFSFNPDGSIEDLVAYWQRMVQISYNPGSGMLELFIFAFEPKTAQLIAKEILTNSSRVINEISAIAREDATRYAREELEQAKVQLKTAREALTAFRTRTRIVDPLADLQGQMGLLTTLQQQLAAALIDFDLLLETTAARDPRIIQAQLRIDVIRKRIEEERSKFGQVGAGTGPDAQDYPTLVAEFERLTVDREFAEQTYTAALSAYGNARAEAERQSRYLATYVRPTLAERAEYPRRIMLVGLITLFLSLAWSVLVLIAYSLRDRQ